MLDIAIALLTAALCSKCLLELPSIFPQKNPRLTHFLSLYTWPQKGPVKVLDEFCDFFSLSPLTNWEQGPSLPGKRGVGLDGPMAHGFGFLLRVSLQHAHPRPFSTEEGLPRDCLYNFDQIYMGGASQLASSGSNFMRAQAECQKALAAIVSGCQGPSVLILPATSSQHSSITKSYRASSPISSSNDPSRWRDLRVLRC